MVKVSVYYPKSATSTFEMAYYLEKHIPMVRQKLGSALKGVAVDQGLAGGQPGTPPPFAAVGHLTFDSIESFLMAFLPVAGDIQGDKPNYTNVDPVIQVSDVKL
jgi:uncharacterized protein (TIGR02118 family)